jgi:hypothetical protein
MSKIKIGDLFSLKNHPYEIGLINVKISALANMTPPILVVSEILNFVKEYDGETGEEKAKQVRCIFYSHKSHKFENYWFNINQIKPIIEFNLNDGNEEIKSDEEKNEIKTSKKEDIQNIGIEYLRSTSLESLKKVFLNNQVILKSCDYELGKLKTTFVKIDSKSSSKINSHLDFLPPVLTVIDIKLNDNKTGYNPKSGNQKNIASYFLLKCKWYNPLSGSFSEDFIPIETIKLIPQIDSIDLISKYISKKILIRHEFPNHIVLESGLILEHSYIQPIELIFNHYKYKLKYFDFFKTKYSEIDLSEIVDKSNIIELNNIILKKIPEYNLNKQEFEFTTDYIFEKNKYYRITYKDLMDKITKRVIYAKEFVKDKVLIADCLLRDGEERHFRINKDSLLKIEELDSKCFDKN